MGPNDKALKRFTRDHDVVCADCLTVPLFVRHNGRDYVVCEGCGHKVPSFEAATGASQHVSRRHVSLILPYLEKSKLETGIMRKRLAPCSSGKPKFIYRAWAETDALDGAD